MGLRRFQENGTEQNYTSHLKSNSKNPCLVQKDVNGCKFDEKLL